MHGGRHVFLLRFSCSDLQTNRAQEVTAQASHPSCLLQVLRLPIAVDHQAGLKQNTPADILTQLVVRVHPMLCLIGTQPTDLKSRKKQAQSILNQLKINIYE
jgi:hypothetical protein